MTKQVELSYEERGLLLEALGVKINAIIYEADLDVMTKEDVLNAIKPYQALRNKIGA